MGNFDKGLLEKDIAESIDFMVDSVSRALLLLCANKDVVEHWKYITDICRVLRDDEDIELPSLSPVHIDKIGSTRTRDINDPLLSFTHPKVRK